MNLLKMLKSCGKKICVCQRNIINFYMINPLVRDEIWNNKLQKLKNKRRLCSGFEKGACHAANLL